MLSPSLGVALLIPLSCVTLRSLEGDPLFRMAASQGSRESSRPAELKLPQEPPVEECGRKLAEAEEREGSEGDCRTPTSMEGKIPASTSCPPAPKKSRRMTLARRKRRPSDLEMLRVGPELMCRLFRPLEAQSIVYLPPAPGTKKRKLHYPDHE